MGKSENSEASIAGFYNEYHSQKIREAPLWMNEYWRYFEGAVLEIGCGTLIPPKDYLDNYFGLDISIEALKQIRRKGVKSVLGSGLNIPFKEKSIETVACHDVLEHVFEPQKLIEEMCRVSKRRVIIYGPNYVGTNFYKNKKDYIQRIAGVLSRQYHFKFDLESPHLDFDEQWESDADAVSACNIYWVKNVLRENGFRIFKAETFMKKKWLNYFPLIKYIGGFMVLVTERKL